MFINTRKFIGKYFIAPMLSFIDKNKDVMLTILIGGAVTLFIMYQLFFGWYIH